MVQIMHGEIFHPFMWIIIFLGHPVLFTYSGYIINNVHLHLQLPSCLPKCNFVKNIHYTEKANRNQNTVDYRFTVTVYSNRSTLADFTLQKVACKLLQYNMLNYFKNVTGSKLVLRLF